MIEVRFRFYGELNELLPRSRRGREYGVEITLRSSLFDAVQSQGVPHTEVALLLLNGEETGWDPLLTFGDRVSVYPQPRQLHLPASQSRTQPPPAPPRFVADVHLGRAATYLRLLGLDTLYWGSDPGDAALARIADEEQRVLLSCDRGLLMHRRVRWGQLLRSRRPVEQVEEVLERYGLRETATPFSRCMACNGTLAGAPREVIADMAPPLVRRRFGLKQEYYRHCPGCGRLFWPGTHWDRMGALLERWGVRAGDSRPAIPPEN